MREKTVLKRCLALLLAFALVVTGLTIPQNDATVAEASDTTETATNIVGDTTADDATAEAKIGEAYFTTFAKALTAANGANGDVTIELLKNITLDYGKSYSATTTQNIGNTNGKGITIDGGDNKYSISTQYGNNAFTINVASTVEFKNMTIVHGNQGSVVQIATAGADVKLTDMTINATNSLSRDMTYNWALINIPGAGTSVTTNLTLDNVQVDMDATAKSNLDQAIIRTGNANSTGDAKKVNITILNQSTLDASGAPGRAGIAIMKYTEATVVMEDSNIYTYNDLPIWNYSTSENTSIAKTRCSMSIASTDGLQHVNASGETEAFTTTYTAEGATPVAQVGNTLYTDFYVADDTTTTDVDESLQGALGAAGSTGGTVELLDDVTVGEEANATSTTNATAIIGQVTISKAIAIDGNMHKITTYAKHTFKISSAVEVNFRNIIFDCYQQQNLIQINAAATVNLRDVDIDAKTDGTAYFAWSVISTMATSVTTTLNLTRVNVEMETGNNTNANYAFLRTGNDGAKTVNIKLDNCDWNLTGAANRKGIAVTKNVTANIEIENSTISTDGTENSQPIWINTTASANVTKTNCTLTNETYEAQIGNTLYKKFCDDVADDTTTTDVDEYEASALTAANGTDGDVTVELLKDVTITATKYFNSTTGVVTVDGNQHVLTHTAGSNLFRVDGSKDVVLKNMDISHSTAGAAVQIRNNSNADAVTVTLENVKVTATAATAGLFNILKTSDMVFKNVDVTMTASSAASEKWSAVIRTGNDGAETDAKTVNITMTECNFDTTGASKRYGILIMSTTTATINITDSTIQTCDVEPIKDLSGTVTVNAEGYTFGSNEMEAQIGYTGYETFAEAISAAKDSTADVTIELLKNVETGTCEIYSENGQGITIDGKGHTLTTTGTGNAFIIRGSADGTGTYEFKNMSVIHKKVGVLVQLNEKSVTTTDEETSEAITTITHTTKKATVKLTDMSISNAENGGMNYGLITTLPTGSDANMTLDLNNVDVAMNFDSNDSGPQDWRAVIRTGNMNHTKTVYINLTDCAFDLSGASEMTGVLVMKSSKANIELNNTSIVTNDMAAIEAQDGTTASTITMADDCTLDAETEEFKNAPIKGYDAQVGNVVYLNFKDALTVANAAADDVTIELLQDFTIAHSSNSDTRNIQNSYGVNITVDGNGYEITTKGGNNAFMIYTDVIFKNMTIVHTNTGSAVQIKAEGINVQLINVTIDATQPASDYNFAIINFDFTGTATDKTFLTLTESVVRMASPGTGNSGQTIIRTGNTNATKHAHIKLVNSTLDASVSTTYTDKENTVGASKRCGIRIMSGTTATVEVIDSTITTLDAAPIYNASTSSDTTITKSGDWKLTCQEYQAQIGNDMYLRAFEDIAEDTATEETEYVASAFTVSQTSTNDVTIEVLQDITLTAAIANFANTAGYSLTVDGNNHTLTTPNSDIHAITIAQYGSTVAMKNMKIDHDADRCLFVISKAGVSFQLEDVVVDATDGVNKWCVINTDYTDTTATTTLDFTRVKIDLDVDTSAASQRAIIRTGNDNNAKYVTINLTDCVLDASGASGRHGISVMNATTATINLKGGSIKTDDTYAIYVKKEEGLESFTMDNTLLTSDTAFYAINPIYNSDGHEVSGKSYTDLQSYRGEGYVDSSYTSNGGSYYYAAKPDGVGMPSDMPIYQVPSDITAGNVFGGWYVDEDLSDALKIDVDEDGNITNEVEGVTAAYAKLVPDHVMSVKAQISKNLIDGDDTNDSTGTIRFVTTTDSLDYHELGFKYSVVAADGTPIMNGIKSSSKVYKEIYALEENGGTMNYHPSIFCTESEYFKTLIIEGVPKAYFDANITVQPFWITYDGTIVWGEEVTKTVQQGIDSTGWQLDNTTSGYTHRVILVSDIHYTTELSQNDYNTTYSTQLAANGGKGASIASGTMLGYTQAQKIQAVLDDISAFAATGRKLDSVLVLGDLTTDDYGYRGLVDNGFLDDFKTDFMDKISASYGSCYALPGNHDSHTTNVWNQLLGTTLGRQYYVEIGDAVFVMLDTFAVTGIDTSDVASAVSDTNGNAIDASGANYSGVDVEWLSEVLKEIDDDKTIFLCSHKYNADTTLDAGFTDLVNSDARIVCMFEAHTHKYAVSSVTDSCKLINVGTYSYKSNALGETTFNSYNTFDEAYAWGFQVLEWNDNEVRTYHVRNARTYTGYEGEDSTSGENKTYEYPGVIENMVTIKLNK